MRWDYLTLAEELGIKGRVSANGRQLHGSCPLHENSSTNFSLNLEDGRWTCYVGCGPEHGRTFVRLVMLVRECAAADALAWLRGQNHEPTLEQVSSQLSTLLGRLQPTREPVLEGPKDYQTYWETTPDDVMARAVLERGFDWETIRRWGLKYDALREWLLIPITDDDRFLGMCHRQMRAGAQPKYLYNTGLEREKILFGLAQAAKPGILLVEGALDAIWLHKHGYPAAAVLGSSFSREQAMLLQQRGFSEVYLGYDADLAGLENTERSLNTLIECGWLLSNVYWVRWPEEASERTGKFIKDANDCSAAQLAKAWQHKERML